MLKPHETSGGDKDLYYKTQIYQPSSNSIDHKTNNNATEEGGDNSVVAPAGVVPWEDVLKHTAFLTISQR